MKKVITIILCLFLISMLAVPAMAAQTATMSVSASQTTVNRGDTITVTISTSSVENCVSGGFMFDFDKNVFEYVSGTGLSGLDGYTAGVSTAAGNIAGYFMNSNATVQGSLFQITLKVKDSAAYGTYSITGTPSLMTADGAVSCSVSSTSVTVACNHSYSNWTDSGNGKHSRTCDICSNTESVNHTWNSGSVTQKATCKEEGVKTYTCTDCNAVKMESIAKLTTHTYDHACDADCNICGVTRTVAHDYKTSWSTDRTSHWHECSVCKDKKDVAAHTPGAEATESEAQTCTACGYVIKAAIGHEHDYAAAWTADDDGHWYACSGCNEKGSYAAHDFENTCDKECSICGFVRESEHKFSETWTADANNHWHICDGCGLKCDEVAHEPGSEATATTAQVCAACGYEIVPVLGVEETTAPTESTDPTTPTTPVDQNTSNHDGLPVWIVIAIAIAAIGGIAAFVVIKKKRP